jgi:hypothetical protein
LGFEARPAARDGVRGRLRRQGKKQGKKGQRPARMTTRGRDGGAGRADFIFIPHLWSLIRRCAIGIIPGAPCLGSPLVPVWSAGSVSCCHSIGASCGESWGWIMVSMVELVAAAFSRMRSRIIAPVRRRGTEAPPLVLVLALQVT